MTFEQAYIRYYPLIYRYLLFLSQNRALAEDLAQETFLKAIKHWRDFRGDCKPETWLCSIAKDAYLDHARKHTGRSGGELTDIADETDFIQGLEDGEQRFAIHQALHLLQEPYKEIFSLRVFAELSYAQIGALFGKSEAWGRVTYYRAKTKLQAAMKGRNQDE